MSDTLGEGKLAVTSSPEGLSAAGDGARTASPPPRRVGRSGWGQRLEIALLAGPAILMFVTFVMFPVLLAAYYGFFKWKGFGPPTNFVGLQNYVTIFKDSTFHDALAHNAVIVVLSLLLQGPAAVLLALLLNQKMRGRSVVRVLIFVPYVVSEVIVGTGWSLMLQTNGAVNGLLVKAGLPHWTVDWLSDPKIAIWSLMLIITWKYIGFAVILFLAGLQGIPQELFEAAAIDGASYWQTQRRITLPLLGPTIRIWAFLSMIGALQLFDLVYIIWGQYVAATAGTSTMATYMVVNGRNAANYGFGTYQRLVLNRDTEGALTEGKK
jgi:raffinose/stachyose/melibiose transport system permease protein